MVSVGMMILLLLVNAAICLSAGYIMGYLQNRTKEAMLQLQPKDLSPSKDSSQKEPQKGKQGDREENMDEQWKTLFRFDGRSSAGQAEEKGADA